MSVEPVDAIGWAASIILVMTVSRQVWTQWRDRSTEGVSKWLFVGQFSASLGFLVYSYLLGNVIFTVSNSLLLLTALLGQFFYLRNKRREAREYIDIEQS